MWLLRMVTQIFFIRFKAANELIDVDAIGCQQRSKAFAAHASTGAVDQNRVVWYYRLGLRHVFYETWPDERHAGVYGILFAYLFVDGPDHGSFAVGKQGYVMRMWHMAVRELAG